LCLKIGITSQALVAQACNPSYSGGRDQKARLANSSRDPISKKHFMKKKSQEQELVEWFKV
jgi:hypothetical protein